MPGNVQNSVKPVLEGVAATDDPQSQIPLIDTYFVALLAKQRARDVLHNDRLHPTTVSLTPSSSPRHPDPCHPPKTPRRRVRHVRHRDRRAITNDLLRSAVTDLEDGLILHIKKRRKLGNCAAKSASTGVLAERQACDYDQSPSVPKGNMVVPLMDLVVSRRKGHLKSLLEEYDLVSRPRDRTIITLDYDDADFLDSWEPSTRDDDTDEWEAVGEPLDPVLTYAEVV